MKTILTATFLMIASLTSFAQSKLVSPQQSDSQENVSEVELKQFVNAFQNVQSNNAGMQQKITDLIEGEGMEVKRYMEILSAKKDLAIDAKLTRVEQDKFDRIDPKLQKLEVETKLVMRKLIEGSGLTFNRYNEIVALLQSDTSLQMRVKTLLGE